MNLSHPNILKLIGVDIDPRTGQHSMISEFMANGNLTDYIHRNSTNRHRLVRSLFELRYWCSFHHLHLLSWREPLQVYVTSTNMILFTEISKGYDVQHQRYSASSHHFQCNILVTNDNPPRACLADFGLSTLTLNTQGATITITSGGTPSYMAPELLLPKKFNKESAQPTKPADIYAFGMVIFEVLTGTKVFSNWQIFEIVFCVVDGERPTKPDDIQKVGLGGGTWELVEDCWIQEPERRPTIEQVLAHLTLVAASSTDVGPIPEIPHNCQELDSSSKRFMFLPDDNSQLDLEGTLTLPQRKTASLDDLTISANQLAAAATIGTISPASTIRLSSNTTSALSWNTTLVSMDNSGGSHRDGCAFTL